MRNRRAMFLTVVTGLTLSGLTSVLAESVVTLRTVGDVAPELSKRVAGWVQANLMPVTNGAPLVTEAKTLDSVALSIVASSNVCPPILVLVGNMEGESRRALVMKGLVCLNLAAMKIPGPDSVETREKYARRIEKEAVGGLAVAMGMSACPLVHCALYSATTLDELDEKARGLCPPCMEKWEQLKSRRQCTVFLVTARST